MRATCRLIDIGANLTDAQFQGVYHGARKHEPDLAAVLSRAWDHDVEKVCYVGRSPRANASIVCRQIIITGTTLEESRQALALARGHPDLYLTVGCHPTRAREFVTNGPAAYRAALVDLIVHNRDKVVAVGETGLDWDRLHFCPKDIQLKFFGEQINLAHEMRLPLFLHMRSCEDDFLAMLREHCHALQAGGVVHSYTGTLGTAVQLISEFNLYIGINGCSLKTAENLAVVKELPIDRLMLETDCPWCDIRPTHAGHKFVAQQPDAISARKKYEAGFPLRGRNEPCSMRAVLDVVAAVKGIPPYDLAAAIHANTLRLLFPVRAGVDGKHPGCL